MSETPAVPPLPTSDPVSDQRWFARMPTGGTAYQKNPTDDNGGTVYAGEQVLPRVPSPQRRDVMKVVFPQEVSGMPTGGGTVYTSPLASHSGEEGNVFSDHNDGGENGDK